MALHKQIELADRKVGGLLLAEGDERQRLTERFFGSRAKRVLELDPEPMLLLATDLLDKGDVRDGQQSWVLGWYGIWMTTAQFVNEMAPKMVGAYGNRGHISSMEWQEPVTSVVWCGLAAASRGVEGLDDPAGTPSAVVYVKPNQPTVRSAVRTAAAQGTLRREFPLSLRIDLDADEETKKVKRFTNEDWWGLDLVRIQGTKGAAVRKPVLLNKSGELAMLTFETMEELLKHADVRAAIEARAAQLAADPQRRKELILSAPEADIREHPLVKPLLELKPRAEALQTLTAEELSIALAAQPSLYAAAGLLLTERQTVVKNFRKTTATEILLAAGLPDAEVARTLSAHDFEHCDAERVRALGVTLSKQLGVKSAAAISQQPAALPEAEFAAEVLAARKRAERELAFTTRP